MADAWQSAPAAPQAAQATPAWQSAPAVPQAAQATPAWMRAPAVQQASHPPPVSSAVREPTPVAGAPTSPGGSALKSAGNFIVGVAKDLGASAYNTLIEP